MEDAASSIPGPAPRRIDRLLADYADQHASIANRVLQALALPLIVWSLIALLTRVPFPQAWRVVPGFDWAVLAVLAVVIGYLGLSWRIAVGLGAFSVLCIAIAGGYTRWGELPIWQLAITTLLFGLGLHFAGRKLEGRRLGLMADLRALLVGPAWLLSLLYRVLRLQF